MALLSLTRGRSFRFLLNTIEYNAPDEDMQEMFEHYIFIWLGKQSAVSFFQPLSVKIFRVNVVKARRCGHFRQFSLDFYVIAAQANAVPLLWAFAISPTETLPLTMQVADGVNGTKAIFPRRHHLVRTVTVGEVFIASSGLSANCMTGFTAKFLAHFAFRRDQGFDLVRDVPLVNFAAELVQLTLNDFFDVKAAQPLSHVTEKVVVLFRAPAFVIFVTSSCGVTQGLATKLASAEKIKIFAALVIGITAASQSCCHNAS